MKIFKKYISFSKLLVFTLVIAFFAITFFDGYIILRPLNMVENGVNLAYATVIGTIVSVMSTFANAVILFAIKGYLSKSAVENTVGYDAKTGTTSEERIRQCCIKTMALATIAKPSDDFSAPTSTGPIVISSSSSEPYKYTYTITCDLGEIVQ